MIHINVRDKGIRRCLSVAVMLVATIYLAGPKPIVGKDLFVQGGNPLEQKSDCDSTGLRDQYCTYSGTIQSPCSNHKYEAAYQTTNQNAKLDKLMDPQGGNYSDCSVYKDCTPERHDRLLDQTCNEVSVPKK